MIEELSQEGLATKQVSMNRNPMGKGGFKDNPQNINEGGRPKNSMKAYLAKKLAEMSDEEKDKFLKEHKVSGKDQIEFGEGKAKQDMGLDIQLTSKIISVDE